MYVRTSAVPVGMNAYDYFTQNWFSSNNVLGKDFWIYDSLNDAYAKTNRWSACNYDGPGVGYPRDCGKSDLVGYQWFAMPNSPNSLVSAARGASFELFTGAQCPYSAPPTYYATVSMDITILPALVLDEAAADDMAKIDDAVTAELSPPDDVDITTISLHETAQGVVRLIASTMSAYSTGPSSRRISLGYPPRTSPLMCAN